MLVTCIHCDKTFEESERWPTCPHPHISLPNPKPEAINEPQAEIPTGETIITETEPETGPSADETTAENPLPAQDSA